jgi:arylsulfatase A-like enzyme
MRVPFVWRPAPSAGVASADVPEPVGHLDLAPTFCAIAGVEPSAAMQGAPLPTAPGSTRERALCEWDSQFPGYGMHMRSIYRDGWSCTAYEPSTIGEPNGLEDFLGHLPEQISRRLGLADGGPRSSVAYDGTEGELYRIDEDPHQFRNLWDDPGYRSVRSDLVADLYDSLPATRDPKLPVARPA